MHSINLSKAAVISLSISLIAATPVNYTNSAIAAEIFERATYYGAQLPSCGGNNDPSYSTGTRYKDNDGQYVTWDCNHRDGVLGNPQECWTEYFLVNQQVHYDGWEISGAAIDCATTSSCANIEATLGTHCTSNGWWAGGSVTAAVEKDWKVVKSTGTIEVNGGGNGQTQFCSTESSTSTCTWSDKKCHTIWKSSRRVQVFGYMRRRCRYNTSGTQISKDDQVYTHTGRGDGAYTVGMDDFDFDLPSINPIIGCAATCDQTTYPDPVPADEAMSPVPEL